MRKLEIKEADSTAEAEYYAASEMAIEILYLRNLLANMGFPEHPDTPVYEDNTACIEWGNHVIGGRERAKHIDIRKHFAHEVIQIPESGGASHQDRHHRTAGQYLYQGTPVPTVQRLYPRDIAE